MQAKGKMAWQPAEEALLEEYCGVRPVREVVRMVQRLNKKQGWPIRSSTAIKVKIKRMGLSRVCVVDNFTPSELARIFSVPRDRVEMWVESKGCPYRKVDGYKGAIRLSSFQKWAAQHPDLLAEIDQDALFYILDDASLVKHISGLSLPAIGRPQAVRRLDTGETFKSVRNAAKKSYVHPKNIREAIRRDGTSAGTKWEYVKKA